MAGAVVQFATADADTASNLSVTFGSPVTPGNAIYCVGACVIGPGLVQTFTFTDNNADTFTIIDNQFGLDSTPMSDSIAFNVAGGTTTINMTLLYPLTGDNLSSQMIVMEISGIFAQDPGLPLLPSHNLQVNNAWPTPGTPLLLSPATAALADPFIVVACLSINDPANVYTAGSGYSISTQLDTLWNGGGQYVCLGVQTGNFTSTGLYTPTIIGSQQPTFTSHFGVNCIAIFAIGEGPPPPPPPQTVQRDCCGTMPTVEVTRDVDADWTDRTTFFITQDTPMPFTLRGLVFRIPYNTD